MRSDTGAVGRTGAPPGGTAGGCVAAESAGGRAVAGALALSGAAALPLLAGPAGAPALPDAGGAAGAHAAASSRIHISAPAHGARRRRPDPRGSRMQSLLAGVGAPTVPPAVRLRPVPCPHNVTSRPAGHATPVCGLLPDV